MERGGRADKLGNRYEGTWVVLQLLQVISGEFISVEIESVGDDERGVDLWIVRPSATREAQQCKRTAGASGKWSIGELDTRQVLSNLKYQLERDPGFRFHFVSGDSAPELRDLCERAEGAGGASERFYTAQIKPFKGPRKAYQKFCASLGMDESDEGRRNAFDLLTRTTVSLFSPGRDAEDQVRALARAYIDGEPAHAVAVLRDLISKSSAWVRRLDFNWLKRFLEENGLLLRDLANDPRLPKRVEALRKEYTESLEPNLIADQLMSRGPREQINAFISKTHGPRLLAVLGDAGTGKSCVLLQLCRDLEQQGVSYLPLRLDTRPPSVSARSFGIKDCDLPEAPALCLHALAGDKVGVLVLDQLDAIRWTSTHGSASWETCKEMLREALQFKSLRIVVACRMFDWATDPQIRAWKKNQECEELTVLPFTEVELRNRLAAVGARYDELTSQQQRLLCSPFCLSLWIQLRAAGRDVTAVETMADLMRRFWEDRLARLKKRGFRPEEIDRSLRRVTDWMEREERLDAPDRLLDGLEHVHVRDALLSEGVLIRVAGRLRFPHQGYFDYLTGLRLIHSLQESKSSISQWVSRGDQALFRREQLRLVLGLLRHEDWNGYVQAIRDILEESKIRFHLKHLVLLILGRVDKPLDGETKLVLDLFKRGEWQDHVIEIILSGGPAWFDVLDGHGLLKTWLDSGQEKLIKDALWVCRKSAAARGDRIGRILRELEERGGEWLPRVARTVQYADAHESRELFEVQLRAVVRGHIPRLSIAWRKLAKTRPEWCVEALETVLRNLDLTPQESGSRLRGVDLEGLEDIEFGVLAEAAEKEPIEVWRRLIPAVTELAGKAKDFGPSEQPWVVDQIWGDESSRGTDPAEQILDATAKGAAQLTWSDFPEFEVRFRAIAASDLLTCQRLAGRILVYAPASAADLAYRWLSEEPRRLCLGSLERRSSWQIARQLLEKFGELVSEGDFRHAEKAFCRHNDPREWKNAHRHAEGFDVSGEYRANCVGLARYMALSAMPYARLSPVAQFELGRLVRKFKSIDQCTYEPTQGATWVGERFPIEAARKLSDKEWARLIKRESERAASQSCRRAARPGPGSPVTLDDVAVALEKVTQQNPTRFARLALRLPPGTDSRILGVILEGCRLTSCPKGGTGSSGSEGWAPVPVDLVEQVLERWDRSDEQTSALNFCRMLRDRAEANWSATTVDKLIWCATKHPDPEPSDVGLHEASDDLEKPTARTLEGGAINRVRSFAAIAIEQLLFYHKEWFPVLEATLHDLVGDPSPIVRCAAIGACVPILNIDGDRAMELFLRAISGTPHAVLAVDNTDRFLAYAVHHKIRGAASVVRRMAASDNAEVARRGALRAVAAILDRPLEHFAFSRLRLVAMLRWLPAAMWAGWHDRRRPLGNLFGYRSLSRRDQVIEECAMKYCGVRCVSRRSSTIHRKAAAELAAEWATHPGYFSPCASLVQRLLSDTCRDVRVEALQIFRHEGVLEQEGAAGLMAQAIKSRAFRDDPSPVLWALAQMRSGLLEYAGTILRVCDVFAGELATESRDISRRISGDVETVATLLLRLYGEAGEGSADLRNQCLDRWDRMLQARVGFANELSGQLDR